MTRRERVIRALNFVETDRVPMDLSGMNSTGVSCFAYPDLVRFLGLPLRRPRVHDTGQMLALPEVDVLDALDCDVATVHWDCTNAYPQDALWKAYDFNGRLEALVQRPEDFSAKPDGTIVQGDRTMPPAAHVFEQEHGGQPLVLSGDIPKPDLAEVRKQWEALLSQTNQLKQLREHCERARESTDRAILFNGIGAGLGIANHTGIAMFPMLCITEPDYVHELHALITDYAARCIEAILSEVAPFIDIYMVCSDDWGTQNQTVASPDTYRDLFKPYYRRINEVVHRVAPEVKSFLHTCGAVYDLLDDFVESGFDVVNPVQWTAGSQGYRAWKDKARGRIALWGGGLHTQATLPLGTLEEIEQEVREVVDYMRRDGGYVFCAIHNLLAEISGEKIAAIYRAASCVKG